MKCNYSDDTKILRQNIANRTVLTGCSRQRRHLIFNFNAVQYLSSHRVLHPRQVFKFFFFQKLTFLLSMTPGMYQNELFSGSVIIMVISKTSTQIEEMLNEKRFAVLWAQISTMFL